MKAEEMKWSVLLFSNTLRLCQLFSRLPGFIMPLSCLPAVSRYSCIVPQSASRSLNADRFYMRFQTLPLKKRNAPPI